MVNYNFGKIYKIEPIVDHDEGDIYIGSTTKQYLSQRLDTHRSNYKQWKNNKHGKVQVFEIFDKYSVEGCQIVLIETVNAESKDELLAREKHYIKSFKCVNKCIPGRTRKEYYQDNYDIIKEKKIVYKENNKEKIQIQNQEYRNTHKEEIKLRDKKYREANLEKLHEFKNRKTACPCGGSYTHCHQSLHFRTIKHQNYLKSQIIDG